jgi:hypothetical protein
MAPTSISNQIWIIVDPTDNEISWIALQPMIFQSLDKHGQTWFGHPCILSFNLTEPDIVLLLMKFGDRLYSVSKETTMGQAIMGNPRF